MTTPAPHHPAPRIPRRIDTLPNALTLARLVIVPFICLLLSGWSPMLGSWSLLAAAILYTAASITDYADGALARKLGVVSRFGRLMDPLADKLLVLSTLVMLAGPRFTSPDPGAQFQQVSGVLPWMVAIIIARELIVTTLRGLAEGEGADYSAKTIGKLKMVAQSAGLGGILWILALAPEGAAWAPITCVVTAWIITLVTAASVWPYARGAVKLFHTRLDSGLQTPQPSPGRARDREQTQPDAHHMTSDAEPTR